MSALMCTVIRRHYKCSCWSLCRNVSVHSRHKCTTWWTKTQLDDWLAHGHPDRDSLISVQSRIKTAECGLGELQEHKGKSCRDMRVGFTWPERQSKGFCAGRRRRLVGLTESRDRNTEMKKSVCRKTKANRENNKLISGGNYGLWLDVSRGSA